MFRRALLILIVFAAAAPWSPAAEENPQSQVVATYFHRTFRCQTCLDIEDLARYAVEMERTEAVDEGRLSWRVVNFEEGANTHYAEEYSLEGPTLVLELVVDGKVATWVKLEETWNLYGDTPKFDAYVLQAIDALLEKAE